MGKGPKRRMLEAAVGRRWEYSPRTNVPGPLRRVTAHSFTPKPTFLSNRSVFLITYDLSSSSEPQDEALRIRNLSRCTTG